MARTPDAADGPSLEEAVIWDEQSSDPNVERRAQLVQSKGLMIFINGMSIPTGEMMAATWQPPVDETDVDTPPVSPTTGYRVIIGGSPTGVFVGHDGEIAQWTGAAWVFGTPRQGTKAYAKDRNQPYTQSEASTPWAWKPGPQGSFGAWYDHEQDPDEQGSTGTTWIEAIRLDFPVDLEEGDYLIMCSLMAYGSSASTKTGLRQVFDSTVLCEVTVQATGSSIEVPMSGNHVQESISGSHSFSLFFNRAGGTGTAYVSNLSIIAIRVR